VITSLTGPYSSNFTTLEKGVKARLAVANAEGGVNGHKLTYVMADDTSTPAGALAATKRLIQQDKVYGILDGSPIFYAAASEAKAQSMPVTGVSFDGGPEWHDKSYTTFFDAYGYADYSIAATTMTDFFKTQGCAKVGSIGNIGLSSGLAAIAAVDAAGEGGLQKGFLDSKLPLTSTDAGPDVIAIKNSGTDCLYLPLTPSLAFSVVAGLRQAGATMKSVVLATGYGGDILASKAGVQAAQGIIFSSSESPVEAMTAATKAFQEALAKYAGETGVPRFGEYVGWTIADLFVYGLKQAGGDASQAQFVSNLRASKTWDAGGLYSQPTDFADPAPVAGGVGPGNCTNMVKLQDRTFVPIEGAMPVCGSVIKGLTISQ